jgi:hypothetical protein
MAVKRPVADSHSGAYEAPWAERRARGDSGRQALRASYASKCVPFNAEDSTCEQDLRSRPSASSSRPAG